MRAGLLIQCRVLLRDDSRRPRYGLVKQVDELDRCSGAGAQDLAVFAEDRSVAHMLGPGRGNEPAGLARGLEDHFQVLALGQADDVQQSRRAKDPEPPADRGQVSGRVPETTDGLLDDQRKGLALAVLEPGGG